LKITKWINFTKQRIKVIHKSLKKIKRAQLQDNKTIKETTIIKRKSINKKFKRILKRKKNFKIKNLLIIRREMNKNNMQKKRLRSLKTINNK
jgi:hypothetical protein